MVCRVGSLPELFDLASGEGIAYLVWHKSHFEVAVKAGAEAEQRRAEKAAAVLASRTVDDGRRAGLEHKRKLAKVSLAVDQRRHASPRLSAPVPPGSPPTPTP